MVEGTLTRWMLRLGAAFVLVFIYFPLVVIGLYAFNDDITQAWPIQNWTTKWFEVAFNDPEVRDAFLLSIKAATSATLIALVLVDANQNFPFGGTSILIIVGVGLETVKQIEAQLQQRHYEGFLR